MKSGLDAGKERKKNIIINSPEKKHHLNSKLEKMTASNLAKIWKKNKLVTEQQYTLGTQGSMVIQQKITYKRTYGRFLP